MTKAQVKPANKQFSTLPHDYEVTLNNDSVIQECIEASDIPAVQYDFVPISQIADMETNKTVGKLPYKENIEIHFFSTNCR